MRLPELHVQSFLRDGGSISQLAEQYGVKARRHARFQNLVCLKYDQINSPLHESIVRDCRGVVLDESNGWKLVPAALFAVRGKKASSVREFLRDMNIGSLMERLGYRTEDVDVPVKDGSAY